MTNGALPFAVHVECTMEAMKFHIQEFIHTHKDEFEVRTKAELDRVCTATYLGELIELQTKAVVDQQVRDIIDRRVRQRVSEVTNGLAAKIDDLIATHIQGATVVKGECRHPEWALRQVSDSHEDYHRTLCTQCLTLT